MIASTSFPRCMLPGATFVALLAQCRCQSTKLPLLATQKRQETILFPPLFRLRLRPAQRLTLFLAGACDVVGVAGCALRSDQRATAWLASTSSSCAGAHQPHRSLSSRPSILCAPHLGLARLEGRKRISYDKV